MLERDRLPFSAGYVGSMIATLYAAIVMKSYIFSLGFSIMQMIALIYFVRCVCKPSWGDGRPIPTLRMIGGPLLLQFVYPWWNPGGQVLPWNGRAGLYGLLQIHGGVDLPIPVTPDPATVGLGSACYPFLFRPLTRGKEGYIACCPVRSRPSALRA